MQGLWREGETVFAFRDAAGAKAAAIAGIMAGRPTADGNRPGGVGALPRRARFRTPRLSINMRITKLKSARAIDY